MTDPTNSIATRQRVVVVADPDALADGMRAHDGPWDVVTANTYLAGIVMAAEPGVRAVVAGLEARPRRIDAAIHGLRTAAGEGVPVLLCCRPHAEPIARRLLQAGADDYLIYPPLPEELDAAIGRSDELDDPDAAMRAPDDEPVAVDAIERLGDMLVHFGAGLGEVLQRLADLVCSDLQAGGVQVAAAGLTARAGDPVESPHRVGDASDGSERAGRLVLGERCDGEYSPDEIERFHQYVRLLSGLLNVHRRESQARDQALTDPVSGLRNRRFLDGFLADVLARAADERRRVTLLLFDVDNFKYYNDTYGHTAGDEIIREVGELMQRCCRSQDAVVRFGGDEYAVVFWDAEGPRVPGSEHPTDPLAVVDRFRDALLNHEFHNLGADARGRLTISGGLATFPWEAGDAAGLIAQADAALLAAKRQGKNRVLPIGAGWLRRESLASSGSGTPAANSPSQPAGTSPEEV